MKTVLMDDESLELILILLTANRDVIEAEFQRRPLKAPRIGGREMRVLLEYDTTIDLIARFSTLLNYAHDEVQ
jgi:hypothetical protein